MCNNLLMLSSIVDDYASFVLSRALLLCFLRFLHRSPEHEEPNIKAYKNIKTITNLAAATSSKRHYMKEDCTIVLGSGKTRAVSAF